MNDVDDDSSGVLTRPVKGGALRARAPVMLATAGWDDYALLDSGNGRKLERYGGYRIVRPEEQAMWSPRRPAGGVGRGRRALRRHRRGRGGRALALPEAARRDLADRL